MGKYDLTPEQEAEWQRKFTEAVRDRVPGEVLAVGPFQRQGQMLFVMPGVNQVGGLFYAIYQWLMRKRAGSLPMKFLLVVTAERVHAFKYRQAGFDVVVKDEVASWPRDKVRVTAHDRGKYTDAVSFEVTEEDGERREIAVDMSQMIRNPWSEKVVELLR